MTKSNGVTFYTHGILNYDVHFANGIETCFNCDFCRRDNVGRDKCMITHEILLFSHSERGQRCPITIIREEDT